ncbi:cytochrome P450 709B1 isoform X2 [Eutrema salsugineum]|uniref:cytochrome P450 709B1 isoform X2 n=1 Tax=Eutrema salsugineum TaxID=72664 RepID=UPI000CED5E09|nr:cytochrome P450 709B1 isoform X2 [Eutrema salsugineum]
MELIVPITHILAVLVLLLIVLRISDAFTILVWQPLILTRRFKKQGISGPRYRILYGNIDEIKKMKRESQLSILDPSSNDVFPRIFPHYQQWMSIYGETFLYWNGTEPRICISDPELAKQVLSSKLDFFVKSKIRPEFLHLVGMKGLIFVEGVDWVRHRRILNPALSIDRIKVMTKVMVDCTLRMLDEWRNQRSDDKTEQLVLKKEMNREFSRLTADIIATAAFGSSYAEGIHVFRTQEELKQCCAISLTNIFIPGTQYLPTPLNFRIWMLDRKLKNSVKKIVVSRLQSESDYEDDLLGIMLKSCKSEENERKLDIEEIIDECRTFFLGGNDSVTNLLTWSTMLLSLHQDWQEKLREEIFKECDEHGVHGVASPVRTTIFVPRSIKRFEARKPRNSQGHYHNFPAFEDAQRQGHLGRRRRQIQPDAIQKRRFPSRQTSKRSPRVLHRTKSLHWPKLCHDRSQDRAHHDPSTIPT